MSSCELAAQSCEVFVMVQLNRFAGVLGQLVGPVKLINNPKQIVIAHSASTPPVQANAINYS